MARNVVDGILEPVIRGVLELIGAILRFIAEIVIRVLIEQVLVYTVAGIYFVIGTVIHVVLATAERIHHALVALAFRMTGRRRLAQAMVMITAIVFGFSAAAGASAAYHHIQSDSSLAAGQR